LKQKNNMENQLYYGDNLEVMRKYIADESVDLCYIDPPFNSKRNYNQIYNNIGTEDTAQVQAFTDTWTWDDAAEVGFAEIINNTSGLMTRQSVHLISMLEKVLGKGSMLAYLVSMTNRIAEIYRVLKPTGSFYLHCDPTASHYLKLVLDGIFCACNGEFQNEITWKRSSGHSLSKGMDNITDTIFFYTKSKKFYVNYTKKLSGKELKEKFPHIEKETGRKYNHYSLEHSSNEYNKDEVRIIQGKEIITNLGWKWTQKTFDKRLAENPYLIYWTKNGKPRYKLYADEYAGQKINNLWDDIIPLTSQAKERLRFPTQKPQALLERIILASSNEGDVVLDAYCGCGTTVTVAEKLGRKWIGIDISYQAISLILKRLEDTFGQDFIATTDTKTTNKKLTVSGVPQDMAAAIELANRKDDRLRKEFEKWAILTYTNNRGMIKDKKGGDGGADGVALISDLDEKGKMIYSEVLFSVKSSKTLNPTVIRDLYGTVERDNAAIGILITLYPMENLVKEARKYGNYKNKLIGTEFQRIQIVTVEEILQGARLKLPAVKEVLKSAERKYKDSQLAVDYE